MIYANLPLKYMFVPIDINNEHFRIAFCVFLVGYLTTAKELWIDIMDKEDVLDGERLEIAEDAKNLHTLLGSQEDNIMRLQKEVWSKKTLYNYHTNITLDNCEFEYCDVSPQNVKIALDIFVEIAEYYGYRNKSKYDEEGISDDEEDEEENN